MTSTLARPTAKELMIALVCLIVLLGGAFIAASYIQDIFRLTPPCNKPLPCNRTPFEESKRLDLHRTFFTAWAALILVTPALCTFWFRRTSETAARYWLAFWTVSFVAFLVHFYWAAFVMFDGDWSRINSVVENGHRVSQPIPDTIFTVLWGIDVLLAWLIRSEKVWIRIPRIIIHLAALGFFFIGSTIEGERAQSRALGIMMGIAVLASLIIWLNGWLKRRKLTIANAT
jgi:hypothetical protein